jgi:Arc/MetJ-type ribon-helix-helix transcriptional regulator
MTNMRPKRITRKIKIGMDEETYRQAKELADKLTFSNLSELVRILVRERYEREKGGKA